MNEHLLDDLSPMDEREHPASEEREGALERPRGPDPALDVGASRVPEASRVGAERRAAFGVERGATAAGPRSNQLQELGVRERAIGGDPQLERSQLCRVQVHRDDARRGTGCYPGVIRGIVRVVRDPREAELEAGEILVAERTDPGWVMLFPAARGLLVERGSLLSHSAIVARELALPAVVAIDGLTSWLETGDEVELDGRTGEVRRLRRARDAA